jgi:nitroimidazol reductase NimA-like FMN-containing flavoprotein (pyridoxamine 5'-phosphate oxidase superfamily)
MSIDIKTGMTALEPDACLSLLRSTTVGRLAVAINGEPDIFPVNFVVDHGTVVFRTAEGTKLAAAVLGRAVAFEVDGYDPEAGEAWSVVLKGRAVEIGRLEELLEAADLPLFPWSTWPKPRFVRIVPTTTTGRRFEVEGR